MAFSKSTMKLTDLPVDKLAYIMDLVGPESLRLTALHPALNDGGVALVQSKGLNKPSVFDAVVRYGFINGARACIEAGVDIYKIDHHKAPVGYRYAYQSNNGDPYNINDAHIALTIASAQGDIAMFDFLLPFYQWPNPTTNLPQQQAFCKEQVLFAYNNALELSCENNHTEIVQRLLERIIHMINTYPNICVKGRHLVLTTRGLLNAAHKGHVSTAKLLLDFGLSAGFLDAYRAFHEACESGHIEIVDMMLKRRSKGSLDDALHRDRCTPVELAMIKGHFDVVKLLVAHGAVARTTDWLVKEKCSYRMMVAYNEAIARVAIEGVLDPEKNEGPWEFM